MRHKEFEKNLLFPFMRGMEGRERQKATGIILFIALVNNLNRSSLNSSFATQCETNFRSAATRRRFCAPRLVAANQQPLTSQR
jgi:hypothetical protein